MPPRARVWHRIPDGFEAPASMDLTAWHRKRIEPAEWSRLFAEGKLAEIIPRGGLKVRLIPAWDTHEPVLLKERKESLGVADVLFLSVVSIFDSWILSILDVL